MAGIQIIGKQAVIDTYAAYGIDTWALIQDKKIRIAGSGSDELEQWLTRFEPAGSNGTYSLRLYEGIEPVDVEVNTPYRYCVDFKLVDMYGGMGVVGGYQNIQLTQKITELEKKLKEYEETEDEDEGIMGILMGYLENPSKLGQIAGAIRTILGGPNVPAQLSGKVGAASQVEGSETIESQAERIAAVIDRLQARDPALLSHLEQLAEIADKKPKVFSMLLANLESM